jgi:membrane protein involved in colicin uptake
VEYNFSDYNRYEGLRYELELITSPEEVQTNKQARRRQRREAKRKEEERRRKETQKREEAALRREAERVVREEAQRQQELEQKKEAERAALVQSVSEAGSANFYDNLDQADSLSEAHAAQRHSMVQSLARELTQGHSREALANTI